MQKKEKVVFITGASRGIGEAITRAMYTDGYRKFVLCCNERKNDRPHFFDEMVNLTDEILTFDFNLCDTAKIEKCVQIAKDRFGRFDVLINNAGIDKELDFYNSTLKDTVDNLDLTMRINFYAPVLLTKLIGKEMYNQKEGGSIINITSTSGMEGRENIQDAAYCASKAALINFTKCAAQAYQPNVRVNSISPGYVRTEQNAHLGKDFEENTKDSIYVGRFAEPSEIAQAVLFLADSEKSSYINSTNLIANGGGMC